MLEQVQEIPLWGARTPPGSEGLTLQEQVIDQGTPGDPQRSIQGVCEPTLTAHLPAQPNGCAVVVIPGGGYTRLVFDKEGSDIARWLNTLGVSAFVLKHRLPGEGHANGRHVPLQDAQRALRLLRRHAAEWSLDPTRIGVLGLSSGGHLAATLATAHRHVVHEHADGIDGEDARPDFAVVCYGPLSGNARQCLIDPAKPPLEPAEKQALYDHYPADRLVNPDTPPVFMMHTDDDASVDARNSIRFYLALKEAGLPAELHIFQHGGHGVALRKALDRPVAAWPKLCAAWLAAIGVLPDGCVSIAKR